MTGIKIQIEFPSKKAAENFHKWYCEEGFYLFTESKYNKLTEVPDDFLNCLWTDEKIENGHHNEFIRI